MIRSYGKVLAFTVAILLASTADTKILPEDLTSIKSPTPGTWNTNFELSYNYAIANNMPIVMFYGATGCVYTDNGIRMLNDPTLRSFFVNNPMIMIFKNPTNAKVMEINDAKTPESSSDPDLWKGRKWVKGPDSISPYPIMRVEWSKSPMPTNGVSFTADNQKMPATEPKGSSSDKEAGQLINTMKMYFAGYMNIPGGNSGTPSGIEKLLPIAPEVFYDRINYSPDVRLGVWNGRIDLCLKKARETGYLLLWFISARGDGYDCMEFLETNLCRPAFCDVINDYKYLILCCSDYGVSADVGIKNAIYGYPEPRTILDENTGEMVENHNGYPIRASKGKDSSGKDIMSWYDYPPSLHLLKVDVKTNILFHICKREGVYDTWFSPYAAKFPIPTNMNITEDAFAPWLRNFLDLYPSSDQIETAYNSSGAASIVTNTVYEQKTVAVTETLNPTVYQMALHRDNILFRVVTSIGDITVVDRIGDALRDFDGRVSVKNTNGKWYINHDRTLASVVSSTDEVSQMDVYADVDCTIDIRQRLGEGFTVEGFDAQVETVIATQKVIEHTGKSISVTTTNTVVTTSEFPFMSAMVKRNETFSTNVVSGKIYRLSSAGNSTFDVFATR